MRKTFNVNEYRQAVNGMLATSECSSDVRQGMINMLEDILFQTGNYMGFRYLMQNQVPPGEKPGINVNSTGLIESTPDIERFRFTDPTRVRYL